MTDRPHTPFDGLDGALEYVGLLCRALDDARRTIVEDVAQAKSEGATRRLAALRLVTYKLDRLEHHLGASHRLLNDLRTLRRLLLGERDHEPEDADTLRSASETDSPPADDHDHRNW